MRSPGPTQDVCQNRQDVKERYIALVRSVKQEAGAHLCKAQTSFSIINIHRTVSQLIAAMDPAAGNAIPLSGC